MTIYDDAQQDMQDVEREMEPHFRGAFAQVFNRDPGRPALVKGHFVVDGALFVLNQARNEFDTDDVYGISVLTTDGYRPIDRPADLLRYDLTTAEEINSPAPAPESFSD